MTKETLNNIITPHRTLLLGIDEARRGELTGCMYVAGVLMEIDDTEQLTKLGVKDSKTLSKNQIKRLEPLIRDKAILVTTVEITPAQIDKNNLNDLEAKAAAKIMAMNSQFDIAIIDNFEPSKQALEARIKKFYPLFESTQLIAEHKADENHVIVAAAGIIAKASSIREMELLKEECGEMGSGNPNDQKTLDWVKKNPTHYSVRRSWSTYRRLMDKCGPSKE